MSEHDYRTCLKCGEYLCREGLDAAFKQARLREAAPRREERKKCTCSKWRLSTFYGEHGANCPVVRP